MQQSPFSLPKTKGVENHSLNCNFGQLDTCSFIEIRQSTVNHTVKFEMHF